MKNLIISEWERLWSRKDIMVLFISVPLLAIITALYYQRSNEAIPSDRAEFVTALNFPVLGLSEHLYITFNLLLLLLIGYIVTEEYQQGHLRLLLLRSFSLQQIFIAKYTVLAVTFFLFLLVYGVSSLFTGIILFDVPEQSILFIENVTISNQAMVFYTLYYYAFAYITGIAVLSLFLFFGIICPTRNSILAVGVSFILFSITIPQILERSTALNEDSLYITFLAYSSITKIQYTGISLLLSGWTYWYWILGVIGIYFSFIVLSYLIFTRRSYFV